MTASPERRLRHTGATGKTLITPYAVGTMTTLGPIVQVRRKKKYANRYLVMALGDGIATWHRHDQIVLAGGQS